MSIKRFFALMVILVLMTSCQAGRKPVPDFSAISKNTMPTSDAPSRASFEDVLAQYQKLNRRLENVSYRLARANAKLCPLQTRSIGITVHQIEDYPEAIKPYARTLAHASDNLRIRSVWPRSPADKAGLEPEDELRKIGANALPSGMSSRAFYDGAARWKFDHNVQSIRIARQGKERDFTVKPETICDYKAYVLYNETPNGYTDGQTIWIASELIRRIDDATLALIVAHEMIHSISGHIDQKPKKAFELEADRKALILLARAGFNLEEAIAGWKVVPQSPVSSHNVSHSHPDMTTRQKNLEQAIIDINTKRSSGSALDFN